MGFHQTIGEKAVLWVCPDTRDGDESKPVGLLWINFPFLVIILQWLSVYILSSTSVMVFLWILRSRTRMKAFDITYPSGRVVPAWSPSSSVGDAHFLHTFLKAEDLAELTIVLGLEHWYLSLSFFPRLRVPLFLWVPKKILSLYDCGLSQEAALALGRKGLFPLSHDCLSIHLFVHLSIRPFHSIDPAPPCCHVLPWVHAFQNERDRKGHCLLFLPCCTRKKCSG